MSSAEKTVGASLLAKALCQATDDCLKGRLREQARSHIIDLSPRQARHYRTSSSSTSNTRTLCGGMLPTP
jgi:hypothetical protein